MKFLEKKNVVILTPRCLVDRLVYFLQHLLQVEVVYVNVVFEIGVVPHGKILEPFV